MHVWIENYMIAQYKYHNQNIDDDSCKRAKRYGILKQMMEMNEGDIIFVLNVGNGCLDESKYYVCQVKKEYYFEDRSQKPNTWEKDFGHIIEVKTLRCSHLILQHLINQFLVPHLCEQLIKLKNITPAISS